MPSSIRPGDRVRVWEEWDAGVCRLVVQDCGQGITEEHLPHIFEPFYRAEKSRRSDNESHWGLGLFLVKTHVEAMGGKISVRSKTGEGATFIVELPDASSVARIPGSRLQQPRENETIALTKVSRMSR